MGFVIRQECPQCGAPVDLEETDRILPCPFCGVRNVLHSDGPWRFVLPHDSPENQPLTYIPYLRFKGVVYACHARKIGFRFVDITNAGASLPHAPLSLGMRPQAMKLRFISATVEGAFLKTDVKPSRVILRAGKRVSKTLPGKAFHRAFIGETVSLIYMPVYVARGKLYDAVLNRPLGRTRKSDEEAVPDSLIRANPKWDLKFLATLCPQCGWDLESARDSVVLTCPNCETAWSAGKGKLQRIGLRWAPGGERTERYLPFWRIEASVQGVPIQSFGDFLKAARRPEIRTAEAAARPMRFWSPAFKIRPKLFLRTTRHLTLAQPEAGRDEGLPPGQLHAVTLPAAEARQSLKLTLADSAVNRHEIAPRLPDTRFQIGKVRLIYLPFESTTHEWIQPETRLALNKNALALGQHL